MKKCLYVSLIIVQIFCCFFFFSGCTQKEEDPDKKELVMYSINVYDSYYSVESQLDNTSLPITLYN